jgi:hypothetical protein
MGRALAPSALSPDALDLARDLIRQGASKDAVHTALAYGPEGMTESARLARRANLVDASNLLYRGDVGVLGSPIHPDRSFEGTGYTFFAPEKAGEKYVRGDDGARLKLSGEEVASDYDSHASFAQAELQGLPANISPRRQIAYAPPPDVILDNQHRSHGEMVDANGLQELMRQFGGAPEFVKMFQGRSIDNLALQLNDLYHNGGINRLPEHILVKNTADISGYHDQSLVRSTTLRAPWSHYNALSFGRALIPTAGGVLGAVGLGAAGRAALADGGADRRGGA